MKGREFINDLKLRAEYGVAGNTVNNGSAIMLIYTQLNYYLALVFLPGNFPNPNLKMGRR